jgi:hypothetical protein
MTVDSRKTGPTVKDPYDEGYAIAPTRTESMMVVQDADDDKRAVRRSSVDRPN